MLKKIAISCAIAALALGSVAQAADWSHGNNNHNPNQPAPTAPAGADWTQKAENDNSLVLTLGGINNAQVQASEGSQVGIQGSGASAGSSVTTYGGGRGPVAQGAKTSNDAANKGSPIVTVGLINNAQVQNSKGAAVIIAGSGASASHSVTNYNN